MSKVLARKNIIQIKDNEDVGVFHLKIWDDFHGLEVDKFPAQGMDCQDYVNNTF